MMINLLECSSESKIIPELRNKYKYFYDIVLNNSIIGLAATNIEKSDDMIFIYIAQEHRGNGYGKEAFKLLINNFSRNNIESILCIVENKNIQMRRIINNFTYKIVTSYDDAHLYEIKVM